MWKWLYIVLVIAMLVLVGVMAIIYINPGPKAVYTENMEWLRTTPIAHRGLHSGDSAVPENSLAAFQQAIEAGYAIELDVHLSADGEIVVFHDYDLQRMTGVEGKITSLPLAELQKLTLLQSDQRIPSFVDVLALIHGQVPLLIEIKNEEAVGGLEQKVIDVMKDYRGSFAVQAFNPFVMGYFKENAPDIVRGQLSGSFRNESLAFYKKFLLRNLLLNGISAPHFVAYEYDSMPQWMANRLKAKNLVLLAWTVNSEQRAEQAEKKFDNIIFELFRP